jgi:hypothetical protein
MIARGVLHIIATLVATAFAVALAAECPSQFTDVDGVCYHLSLQKLSWVDGEIYCEGMGGGSQLATFDRTDKFHDVCEKFTGMSDQVSWWIGYHQIGHKGQYKGVDGTVDYRSYWEYSQPNNAMSLRDCAMTRKDGRSYSHQWYSEDCSVRNNVLCKAGRAKLKLEQSKSY